MELRASELFRSLGLRLWVFGVLADEMRRWIYLELDW